VISRDVREQHESIGLEDAARREADVEWRLTDRHRRLALRRPPAQCDDDSSEDFLVPVSGAGLSGQFAVYELEFRGRFGESKKVFLGHQRTTSDRLHFCAPRSEDPAPGIDGSVLRGAFPSGRMMSVE